MSRDGSNEPDADRRALRDRVYLLVVLFLSLALIDELLEQARVGGRLDLFDLAEGLLPWLSFAAIPTRYALRLVDRLADVRGELEDARGEAARLTGVLGSSRLLLAMRLSDEESPRIEWVNRAFERETGLFAETLIGRTHREIDPEHVERLKRELTRRPTDASSIGGDSSFARRDGTRLPVRYELIEPAGGGPRYTFAIDRSTELLLETRLAESSDELIHARLEPSGRDRPAVPKPPEIRSDPSFLGARRSGAPPPPQRESSPLTVREREVLAHAATGATGAEIAERLFISVHTVSRHLANTYTKIGVRNRTEAVGWALAEGLIEPAGEGGEARRGG